MTTTQENEYRIVHLRGFFRVYRAGRFIASRPTYQQACDVVRKAVNS